MNRTRYKRRAVTAAAAFAVSISMAVTGLTAGTASVPAQAAADSILPTSAPPPGQSGAQASEQEAAAEARRTGAPVEVASLRGESSEVFVTPEGHLEAREHLRPVHTRIGGAWTPIDTTLARTGDGMVAPRAATVSLAFSGGGDVPLVRMAQAGRQLALSWPGSLPTPQVEGDTATYVDVLPGVDLRLKAQQDGFSQVLVVKSAQAAADARLTELRLKLAADGMSVRKNDAGGLSAIDNGSGGAVFETAQPLMWDSSPGHEGSLDARSRESGPQQRGTAGEPGPAESGKLTPVGVDVPSGGAELVLRPDTDVLRGQNTVYPVFIDPQWYTPKASAWTMVSKYWASSPQWKFNGESDAGMGYCLWYYCNPYDTKRLFYRLPTSRFAGRTILSAEFVVRNTWSASCDARGVQVWRTKDISSSTTWNTQEAAGFWIDHLKTESFAYGYDGCASKDAEFDVKPAVQQAAKGKWSTVTLGLRASDENDKYGWKRFADDAYLRVRYNRPPTQIKMSQLSMEYGGLCKRPADAPYTRTLGKIYANNVSDPDGDNVSVQFMARWDGGEWKPSRTTTKKSYSDFSLTLPSSIPKDKQIHWFARVHDGAQYSPWSYEGDATSCYFFYDPTAPAPPTVTSAEYPASNSDDPDDPWHDGMGQYGRFTLKSADTGVVKYWWGLNVDPSSDRAVTTTGGAERTIKLLPPKIGVNTLFVRSFDAAGNASAPFGYRFRVRSGQQERAGWQMDENAGAAQVAGVGAAWPAGLHGGLRPGGAGVSGTGLTLDGTDDHAATEAPVLDTGKSFSVALWARLPADKPARAMTAISQAGQNTSGFELFHSGTGGWTFMTHASDSSTAAQVKAEQPPCPAGDTACAAARLGVWTHVTGVFDNAKQQIRLYVNGVQAAATTYIGPWDARARTILGASGMGHSWLRNFFAGDLDEVQLFDYQLPDDQITRLSAKQPVITNRPAKLIWTLDDQPEQPHLTGRPQQADATLRGGARLGAPGVSRTALELDGVDDHATMGRPLLDTAQSFTVSAWAWLPGDKPSRNMSVIGQAGVHNRGFELYHSSSAGWVFMRAGADNASAPSVRAVQNPCGNGTVTCPPAGLGKWTHLTGVYDRDAGVIQLYVNGQLKATQPFTAPWYAGGEVTLGAAAAVGTLTGPVSHFQGKLDDLRVHDRLLSGAEITQLFKQRPVVTGRWKFDVNTVTVTYDDTESRNNLTLHGGASVAAGSKDGSIDGQLQLSGSGQYATSAAVPVDTSASFTVSVWVKAASYPSGQSAVLTIPGLQQSAITLRYTPPAPSGDPNDPPTDPGRWRASMADSDAAGAAVAQAEHGQFFSPTEWNHVVVVYDAFTNELTLYVKGEPQGIGCADDDGNGEPDDPTCKPQISWTENTRGFKSAQPLQVGRAKTGTSAWGEYWPGLISDLWTFQGTLTELQIAHLAVGQSGLPSQVPGL
ncbi:LamG-like jellyroll fold domain-containing protein [[Actinomadura] parvosata]|uniref:LamG-like jellyroll fold domain-containing protein n=1 Tax=[Actinomadura] parvosata TaxID=1955412 RepID=UPI00406CDB72